MSTIVTRAGKGSALSWAEADANFTNLNTDKAELASPTFTGAPAAPTPTQGDNGTSIATTAFVNAEIAADRPYSDTNPVMDGTAAQGSSANISRQDHVHPSDTTKANLAGATFTGSVSATTGLTVKAAATGSNDGNVVSGTYTPTATASSNANTVSAGVAAWSRIGSNVTIVGTVTFTSPSTALSIVTVTMPFAVTSVSSNGSAGVVNDSTYNMVGYVAAFNTPVFALYLPSNSGSVRTVRFVAQLVFS